MDGGSDGGPIRLSTWMCDGGLARKSVLFRPENLTSVAYAGV